MGKILPLLIAYVIFSVIAIAYTIITVTSDPTIYLKITNSEENHHGFPYKDGLNILEGPITRTASCYGVPNGLHFARVEHIHRFIYFGCNLRIVRVPRWFEYYKVDVIDFEEDGILRSNSLILGKKMSLGSISTYEYLESIGADLSKFDLMDIVDCAGDLNMELIDFLIEKKIFGGKSNELVLIRVAMRQNQPSIVERVLNALELDFYEKEYLNEAIDYAITEAASKNMIDMVKVFLDFKIGNTNQLFHAPILKGANSIDSLEMASMLMEDGIDPTEMLLLTAVDPGANKTYIVYNHIISLCGNGVIPSLKCNIGASLLEPRYSDLIEKFFSKADISHIMRLANDQTNAFKFFGGVFRGKQS